jgi:hypothetical protein
MDANRQSSYARQVETNLFAFLIVVNKQELRQHLDIDKGNFVSRISQFPMLLFKLSRIACTRFQIGPMQPVTVNTMFLE